MLKAYIAHSCQRTSYKLHDISQVLTWQRNNILDAAEKAHLITFLSNVHVYTDNKVILGWKALRYLIHILQLQWVDIPRIESTDDPTTSWTIETRKSQMLLGHFHGLNVENEMHQRCRHNQQSRI